MPHDHWDITTSVRQFPGLGEGRHSLRAGRPIPAASSDAMSEHLRMPLRSQEALMSKRSRKRRARKSHAANHGRKPNA